MSRASESNRAIARRVADAFGGQPTVLRHHDEGDTHSVFIATRPDSPTPGVNSHATLGLSDHPLIQEGREYPARLEILGAATSDIDHFDQILATAAFFIIKDRWFCAPGFVFPDIVGMYDKQTHLPHLYFTTPFLWDNPPQTMELPDKTVAFLQAIPISDSERQYLADHDPYTLETRFEENDIDVTDLTRESVA